MGCIYIVTTPIGIAIGIGIHTTFNPNSPASILAVSILDSLSAGILLYSAYVELIAMEMNHNPEFLQRSFASKASCFVSMVRASIIWHRAYNVHVANFAIVVYWCRSDGLDRQMGIKNRWTGPRSNELFTLSIFISLSSMTLIVVWYSMSSPLIEFLHFTLLPSCHSVIIHIIKIVWVACEIESLSVDVCSNIKMCGFFRFIFCRISTYRPTNTSRFHWPSDQEQWIRVGLKHRMHQSIGCSKQSTSLVFSKKIHKLRVQNREMLCPLS